MQAYRIRPVTSVDQSVLWDILYEALWDPPQGPRRPRSVMSHPFIAAYVENWGSNPNDLGFLAEVEDGAAAGGILSRLMLPPLQGGAFFDESTPQLGIAVFPAYRGQGIGSALFRAYLQAAAARYQRVSLGVHPENQTALRLYRKLGFVQFATGAGGYLNLVKDLSSGPGDL